MRTIIITAVAALVIGVLGGWLIFHTSGGRSGGNERKILAYRDPMNPANTSPTPKKGPDGMDYIPVYEETAQSSAQRKIAYYQDPMHPWYTSDKPGKAPDCGMDLVPVYEGDAAAEGIRIDPAVVQNIGVQTEPVTRRKLSRVVRTVGKVDFNETKIYSVNTKIMGWVERLYVDYTGQLVKKGEPLLDIYSPDLVTTQEEYLQAIKYRKTLAQSSSADARAGAESLVESARRRLLNWDIPEKEINALEERGMPKKVMTIFAPVDGFVMEKMVQKGQNVMSGMELYKIADISTVWIIAEIYQFELSWVKIGQKAEVELSYMAGKIFSGTVSYIYPMLNMETKTARVRIALHNTLQFQIKPEMFATVKIASPVSIETLTVPEQSIIRSGERDIVVVALGGGYFDPREVKLGASGDGYVQVLEGLHDGETIVTSSQFLIDSESNLKAAIRQMSGRTKLPSRPEGDEMSMPSESSGVHGNIQKGEPEKKNVQNHLHGKNGMDGMQMNGDRTEDPAGTAPAANETKNDVKAAIDPVCGMETNTDSEYSFAYAGKTYYFCSEDDMNKFKGNPGNYVDRGSGH